MRRPLMSYSPYWFFHGVEAQLNQASAPGAMLLIRQLGFLLLWREFFEMELTNAPTVGLRNCYEIVFNFNLLTLLW